MRAIAHSFFAVFVGWLIPFVGLLAFMQFGPGFGYITDFNFFLFWPLVFTVIGWLVVGIALALRLSRRPELKLSTSVIAWTLATTVSFLVVAALFRFGILFLVWWPAAMGLIAGFLFWFLQRGRCRPAWIYLVLPMAFFPFVRYAVVPAGIRWFPYTTYVLAEGVIGSEALLNVIRSIRVGDTYAELHTAYPQLFGEPIQAMSWGSGDGSSYSIEFDAPGGRVVRVSVGRGGGETTVTIPP